MLQGGQRVPNILFGSVADSALNYRPYLWSMHTTHPDNVLAHFLYRKMVEGQQQLRFQMVLPDTQEV